LIYFIIIRVVGGSPLAIINYSLYTYVIFKDNIFKEFYLILEKGKFTKFSIKLGVL